MFTDSPLKKAGRKAANALLRAAEQADFTGRIESPTEHWKQPHIMSAINLHNNRVGRKVKPSTSPLLQHHSPERVHSQLNSG